MNNDLISRQAAIDALKKILPIEPMKNEYTQGITCGAALVIEYIKQLPSAQPEPNFDEWCTDCKEYDQERHCCPRFNRVIRNTLKDVQLGQDAEFWKKRAEKYADQCINLTDEMVRGVKIDSIRIDENGVTFTKNMPEQKWIPCSERLPDKSNFYICTKKNRICTMKNRLVKTVFYSAPDGAWGDNVIAWMPLPEPYR